MLCRKGCRCEQQYRLHRLLAFDPNNECRGIFSNWFRFPSYCICKCYNFPSDFLSKPEHEPPSKDDDEKIVFEDNDINKQQHETLPNPSPQLQVLSQQKRVDPSKIFQYTCHTKPNKLCSENYNLEINEIWINLSSIVLQRWNIIYQMENRALLDR